MDDHCHRADEVHLGNLGFSACLVEGRIVRVELARHRPEHRHSVETGYRLQATGI